jgi:hypothetical protein
LDGQVDVAHEAEAPGQAQAQAQAEPPAFQALCVLDDNFIGDIINTSCRLFHGAHRWDGYPRTLDEDLERALRLASRGNVAALMNRLRWFFLPCSDPARIPWEGLAEPLIANALAGDDVAGLHERGLIGRMEYLLVFFGDYLTHSGDFPSAERFFLDLIARGLEAEGFLGLADIRHTFANWRDELQEYEDRRVYPRRTMIPASCAGDPLARLEEYDLGQAIAFYERAVRAAPGVSFYRLHLARARIDQGDLEGARADLAAASAAANPNPLVAVYLNLVERLIRRGEKSTGDFMPTLELRERYHSFTVAPLVGVDTLAELTGAEPVVLAEDQRLQGSYVVVMDGKAGDRTLDLEYPAPKGLQLSVARDLASGQKLAYEQFVIAEGPPVGRRRLKMFTRPLLMTGPDHVLVGLPRQEEVTRSDRMLTPLPGSASNYYHWLIDTMGAVMLLDRQQGLKDHDFLVNRLINPWQREILDLAAPQIRLHALPGPTEQRVLINAFHLPHPSRLNAPHPEAIRLLRQRMSRHGPPRKGKRVWVGRLRLQGRMTVNETGIQEYLARHGFEQFDPTGKTVAEQIAFFSDIEVLVALGGAALTNLLFCPDETKVVIISSAFHYHETFTAMAVAIGQPCWTCLAGSELKPNPYMTWAVFDQEVHLQDIAVAVEQACRA